MMAVDVGTRGLYHADNGDATAEFIRDHGEDQGDTIAVLSDGDHGSGLSKGWTIQLRVKRGSETGEWSPGK